MKFIQIFKNRTVLGVTCIAVSMLICFVLSPLISRTSAKTVTVLRAAGDIKSGDEITKNMVTEVKMTSTNQPPDIISSSKDVIGKYAALDMVKGDYVLKAKVSDLPYVENTYLSGLDGTNRAISITLKSFANGLSGKLKPGDIVSVIAPDYKRTGMTVIPSELQFVEVIAATAKTGTDVEGDAEDEADLPSTVTLLVSEEQAVILAELEKTGTIHLSLVYRGDRENAKKFIEAQEELNNPESKEPTGDEQEDEQN